MRAIIQRVSKASVLIEGKTENSIGKGLMILLGITDEDTKEDINWLVRKITQLRIFSDARSKMNLDIQDIGGSILLVSQFTLYASVKKGNRPSFIRAAHPDIAQPLYNKFVESLRRNKIEVKTGIFGADMKVTLTNDGPVTIWMDSQTRE